MIQRFLSYSFLFYLLSVGLSPVAKAQTETQETQLWLDFYQYHFLNTKLEYFNDFGIRFTFPTKEWTMVYARPSFSYRFKYWGDALGGIGIFYTFQNSTNDQLEVRPWQGLKLRLPKLGNIPLTHYFRLEERFVWDTKDWVFSFSLRGRYRLGARFPIGKPKIQDKTFYVRADGEVFLNIGKVEERVADRLRFRGGMGYQITRFYRAEINYTLQLGRNTQTTSFAVAGHLIQFKLIRRIFTED